MKSLTGHWLLGQDFLDRMVEYADGFALDQTAYTAFLERRSRRDDGEDLFIREGSTAHIPIIGVLTVEPDFFFDLFGGGSVVYGDVVAAIEAAELDEGITDIVLEIDSPGGDVAGFQRTAEAIRDTVKPTEAQITNLGASAAFGLAAQTGRIVVDNVMAMVGSVGIATTVFVSESRVVITSTEAPDKRPDVTTAEGVAAVKRELDAIHAEFAGIIASGRGVSVAEVNADFGRGALVIANDALQFGMIDGIGSMSARGLGDDPLPTNTEGRAMTREELQAKHPEVYAAIYGNGVTAGIAQERDRCTAHVNAAADAGQPELAAEHILSGADLTSQVVRGSYMTAALNRGEADNRLADDAEANGLTSAKSRSAVGDSKPDEAEVTRAVFAKVREDMGLEAGA